MGNPVNEVYIKVTFMREKEFAFINNVLYRKYDDQIVRTTKQGDVDE